jgi:hypothetical protein
MARPSCQVSAPSDVEGQAVTNWRLIGITSVLEILFLVGLMLTWRLLPGSQPKPASAPIQAAPVAAVPAVPTAVSGMAEPTKLVKTVSENPTTSPTPPANDEKQRLVASSSGRSRSQASIGAKVVKTAANTRQQHVLTDRRQGSLAEAHVKAAVPMRSAPADPPGFKRLNCLPEEALADLLLQDVPELDVDSIKGTSAKLLAQAKSGQAPASVQTVLDLLPQRSDLGDLPFRKGPACQADKKAASQLQATSILLRSLLSRTPERARSNANSSMGAVYFQQALLSSSPRFGKALFNEHAIKDRTGTGPPPRVKEEAVPALAQLLQAEDESLRLALVRLLSPGSERLTTKVLAQRALFDFSPEVREEAVQALKERPLEDSRQFFLDGLRYPWFPVSQHAAEALAALQDRQAVAGLLAMLDQPDPAAPLQREDKKWIVPELVRVNHLRNCLLCHSPSFAASDLVRAPVPKTDEPLPTAYYGKFDGAAIRADVTYLRQDFSVCQPVLNPGKWPAKQRYDYLVRKRVLSGAEASRLNAANSGAHTFPQHPYPQREAVLFALRELTGADLGPYSGVWKKSYAKKGT